MALIYQPSSSSIIKGTKVAVVIAVSTDPDMLEGGLTHDWSRATRLSDVVLVDDGSASTAAVDRLEL